MTNLHLAGFLAPALALTLAASAAAAQSPPVSDGAPPSGEDRPPAIVSAFEVAPYGPAAAPVSYVRLNLHALDDDHKRARVYLRANDSSALLCAQLPCTVDVPAGSELRATWAGDVMHHPHVFIVPSDPGREVDIEVSEASAVPLVTAVVLVVLGGAGMASGIACEASIGLRGGGEDAGCAVAFALGAVVLVSGIVLNAARSREPSVTVDAPRPAQQTYGRKETALGDAAPAKRRDAAASAPTTLTPLTYGFSF